MKKLFASLIFGLLVLGIAPVSMMDAYAQSTLYAIGFIGPDGLSQLYILDTTTGIATPVGTGIGFERCSAMDFLNGILYALCERDDGSDLSVLITINLTTGVGTEVGLTNAENVPGLDFFGAFTGMSFRNSDGVLYAHAEEEDVMATININTGQATDLSAGNVGCAGNAVAFTLADILLLASCDELTTIDQTTGGFVSEVTSPNFVLVNGMDSDPATGILFGIENQGFGGSDRFLVTIDPTDFSFITSVSTEDGMDAIAFLSERVIGGELLPIDSTALLLAAAQSPVAWLSSLALVALGIGAYVFTRKPNNMRNIKVILRDYLDRI